MSSGIYRIITIIGEVFGYRHSTDYERRDAVGNRPTEGQKYGINQVGSTRIQRIDPNRISTYSGIDETRVPTARMTKPRGLDKKIADAVKERAA